MVREGYKQTEVGVIPKDWCVCYLQDLTDKVDPITYGVLKPGDYVHNGIPLLQIKDVIHGEIDIQELHRISKELDSQYSRTRLSGGEIVVSLVGTIGKIAYIPDLLNGANLHRNLAKISISPKKTSKFIFYQLESEYIQKSIKITTFGSTQSLLNLGDLRALLIAVPPLPEQRAIAQALSDVDALLAALDKLIAKKRNLKTATMQQLLTGKKRLPGFGEAQGYKQTEVGVIPEDWEETNLADIVEAIDGDRGTNYPSDGDFSPDGYCLFLSARNVTKDGFRFSECFFITEAKDRLLRKGRLSRKDVVLTTRGTVGNFAFFDDFIPYEAIRINSGMVLLRNKSEALDHRFLYIILKSYLTQTQIERAVFGSAQPQLTVKGISDFRILLPPIKEEQRAIATVLSDMDTEIAALETRLAKTQALKQGMMQELLTGRTRLV